MKLTTLLVAILALATSTFAKPQSDQTAPEVQKCFLDALQSGGDPTACHQKVVF
ncbi:hypothetical protein HDV00_008680 [Rhizophlyctis rosea]|nr:hypothetical protein HDV00_008680 [Rhizophlyctis rosea]